MIRSVTKQDIPQWKEIIREVEPLFGTMLEDPTFLTSVKAAIREKTAFCYADAEAGQLKGVIIINRDTNSIEWLAVASASKNEGLGTKLVQKAMDELDVNKDIFVQTFSPEIGEGIPARKLYKRFGFIDFKEAGNNPAGINTVIMIKKPAAPPVSS